MHFMHSPLHAPGPYSRALSFRLSLSRIACCFAAAVLTLSTQGYHISICNFCQQKSAGIIRRSSPYGKLFLLGSTYGAVIGTGTAFDALFGIDFELSVALFDRLYGAISSASSAANASISNLVCHFFVPP